MTSGPATTRAEPSPEREVHPAAAVWPMLPDEELRALADSIAEVGLLEPIVLTAEGLVLDGRNRLAACALAGIEPTTVVYGGDPAAFVLARNEHRRHMTKGQRAMAAYETAVTSLIVKDADTADSAGVSAGMVSWAKTVHEHAPGLAPLVISGARPLKDAYDEARKVRDDREDEQARLERLPDELAALVREESMTLREAEVAIAERERWLAEQHRDATRLLTRVLDLLAAGETRDDTFVNTWLDRLCPVDNADELAARIDDALDVLSQLAKGIRT